MKLLNYRRSELKLSDHRPVIATFTAEVGVFSHRKPQKALTLTDAEVEDREILSDIDITTGMGCLRLGEVCIGEIIRYRYQAGIFRMGAAELSRATNRRMCSEM